MLRNFIFILYFAVIGLFFSSCGNDSLNFAANSYQTQISSQDISPNYSDNYVPSGVALEAINQHNNLQLSGFALKVNDFIYFADAIGVHKTDMTFTNIQTLVFASNNNDLEAPNNAVFDRLQMFGDKIYFRNIAESAIYSMYSDGTGLTRVLDIEMLGYDVGDPASITEFVVLDGRIYFNFFTGTISLKSLDLSSREIIDLAIEETEILTVGVDGKSLQFSMFGGKLSQIDDEIGEIVSLVPSNMNLFKNVFDIGYTTNCSGLLAFVAPWPNESRIFTISEGSANEIYQLSTGVIEQYINSLNDWIYFTVYPTIDHWDTVSLYRIKNDGSVLELISENISQPRDTKGIPTIFINLLSEDVILFKMHPRTHEIYALKWNLGDGSYYIRQIN